MATKNETGLSLKQQELLDWLRARRKWRTAPLWTTSQTILSLRARGLIEMRLPTWATLFMLLTYKQYQLRALK
jgi:hypothetical protein